MDAKTRAADWQVEKINLNGDELPIEVKRTRPPDGKPEVVVVTGASAGVRSSVVSRKKERASVSSRAVVKV